MPAPYQTIAELIAHAHARHTSPLTHILDTAADYEWTEAETVAIIEAYARHADRTRPEPQPLADIIAIANEFAADLDAEDRADAIRHAVANYTSAAWHAAQTDDPAAVETLEYWEATIAEVIGRD